VKTRISPGDVAILTVHGNSPHYRGAFARRHPWPRLQLEQLRRHTPSGYRVLAYGNELDEAHESLLRGFPEVDLRLSSEPTLRELGRNPWPALDYLARQAHQRFRYLVVLDSDAFPVAPGWLEHYIAMLDEHHPLVAVQRLENGDDFAHPSFMVFASEAWRRHRFYFSPIGVKDVGAALSEDLEADGLDWHRLVRTNRWNPHPLMAGVYDDRIYHHGGGTRKPSFRANREARTDPEAWRREVELHRGLFAVLFEDPQGLAERLLGRREALREEELRSRGRAAPEGGIS
jgi:hypothetical protein